MNLKLSVLSCALLGAIGSSAACYASTLTYTASLGSANEVPANSSTATGFVTYTLTGDILTVDLSFTGLSTAATAAHIHCCVAAGANAPVVIPFALFPNTTSGTYTNVFDLSTFVFSGGGTESALVARLNAGTAYTNIHNSTFPGGEIRGQISPVPELGSITLLGTGMLGLLGAVRRHMKV